MSPRHLTNHRIPSAPQRSSLLLLTLAILLSSLSIVVAASPPTAIHKAGYCALRGEEKKSLFGGALPAIYNGPSFEPEADVRKQLVELCGPKWNSGSVCCEASQVANLEKNLNRVVPFLASCPACQANFNNMFCELTCSPDQSLFLNVTDSSPARNGKVVEELDYFVSPTYGETFYDSCKDVKFGATNGRAMDLVGNGAKNYTEFFKFLGRKQPFLGSPYQINFPPKAELKGGMKEMKDKPKKCNDDDEAFRCACLDCPAVCPILPDLDQKHKCNVGLLPCWSFSVIIIYSVLVALGAAYVGYFAVQKHHAKKVQRRRLLQPAASDDEDDTDAADIGFIGDRQSREYTLNTYLDTIFYHVGRASASFPAVTIAVSVLIVGLLSLGWNNFQVETDPVRLWVSPTSDAAVEKQFFDDNFGPFYRTQQAFLINDTTGEPGPILSYETLQWWFDIEQWIKRTKSRDYGVTLDDVCLNPMGTGCVVQSITGYFQSDIRRLTPNNWESQVKTCANRPTGCLPEFGQPLKKEMVFGGYDTESGDVLTSKALLVTWVVNNHEGGEELAKAEDWERSLKSSLLAMQADAKERGLRLSFSTEISLEQELNKSTNTDAKIVAFSYIAMFFYASIALGSSSKAFRNLLNNPGHLLVDSKFTLGVFGIVIVLMSVSASVGLFSALGIKVTLIIAEVIPFLILAVGVDNIFLIVHEFERVNNSHPSDRIEDRIGNAMGRMGPSILLSATSQTVAFALGAVVSMPAVRNFAIYAAGAVFINAILQVTMFVAVLSLNQKRAEAGRIDCFPCIKEPGASRRGSEELGASPAFTGAEEEGVLQKLIRKKYAPFLLQRNTKLAVVTVFLGIFAASLALLPGIELGLDQRIAIPKDSYLIDYFDDLYDYFAVGPPVYFVSKDLNATSSDAYKSLCGRFSGCKPRSVSNLIEQERKRPENSYIADPAASWVDDFLLWLNPQLNTCCWVERTDPTQICKGDEFYNDCRVCFEGRDPPYNITLSGMPQGTEFMDYLKVWLDAPTTADCPLAGKAAYTSAIVPDYEHTSISTSHFRTSHTPLTSQEDFIAAYASARRIAADLSDATGATVFPYSKFYIFFSQYATLPRLTFALLASCLLIILTIATILLGSLTTAAVLTLTVAMTITSILGIMSLWSVSLNAVSLVNLLISVGIAVEFCSHISRAFMFTPSPLASRDARVHAALTHVGASVFSGITVTKAIGVSVLAFTRSKIFEIYYFRVWVALVGSGALHALVWLPVVLSLCGARTGWDDGGEEEAQGIERDLRRRGLVRVAFGGFDDSDDDEE